MKRVWILVFSGAIIGSALAGTKSPEKKVGGTDKVVVKGAKDNDDELTASAEFFLQGIQMNWEAPTHRPIRFHFIAKLTECRGIEFYVPPLGSLEAYVNAYKSAFNRASKHCSCQAEGGTMGGPVVHGEGMPPAEDCPRTLPPIVEVPLGSGVDQKTCVQGIGFHAYYDTGEMKRGMRIFEAAPNGTPEFTLDFRGQACLNPVLVVIEPGPGINGVADVAKKIADRFNAVNGHCHSGSELAVPSGATVLFPAYVTADPVLRMRFNDGQTLKVDGLNLQAN